MSTFKGRLNEDEFKKICIDYFEAINYDCTAFFLSHFHSDHMQGITDKSFSALFDKENVFFYCSEITKSFIVNDKRIEIPEGKIIVLHRSTSIEMGEGWVKVTPLPAGHCPGSIMLMFEGWKERVIYTGDCRLTLSDLEGMRELHTSGSSPRQVLPLSTLYFDSTFAHSQYPDFPTRQHSLLIMKEKVSSWIQQDPSYKVIIHCSANVGSEFLMIEMGKMLGERIHVSKERHEQLHSAIELLGCVLTVVPDNAKVHFCYKTCNLCFKRLYSKKDLLEIKPSALIFTSEIQQSFGWHYFDPKAEVFRVAYSSHASLNEIINLIRYLKPSKLHPCVLPREEAHSLELQHLVAHLEGRQIESENNTSV